MNTYARTTIRLIALALVVILALGIIFIRSFTLQGSFLPHPTHTPTPTPLFTFHGTGNGGPFFRASTPWVPLFSCTGNADISIQVENGNSRRNETSNTFPCNGNLNTEWTAVLCSGSYKVNVFSQGTWTLVIEPVIPHTGKPC